MNEDYTEVFRSSSAARKYDEGVYARGTLAWSINERVGAWLGRLATESFPDAKPVQHDFACGTGRVIQALQGHVAAAHGYDTSAAMLERARARGLDAELHLVRQDGAVPEPASVASVTRPAIVTVFRLLLNAGPEVRDRAVAFAARVLPDAASGLLVVENHGNSRSLRHVARLWRGSLGNRGAWFNELSHREVRELLARHGFRVESMRGFSLLPRSAFRFGGPLRPWIERLDRWASTRRALAGLSTCVVYTARRVDPEQPAPGCSARA